MESLNDWKLFSNVKNTKILTSLLLSVKVQNLRRHANTEKRKKKKNNYEKTPRQTQFHSTSFENKPHKNIAKIQTQTQKNTNMTTYTQDHNYANTENTKIQTNKKTTTQEHKHKHANREKHKDTNTNTQKTQTRTLYKHKRNKHAKKDRHTHTHKVRQSDSDTASTPLILLQYHKELVCTKIVQDKVGLQYWSAPKLRFFDITGSGMAASVSRVATRLTCSSRQRHFQKTSTKALNNSKGRYMMFLFQKWLVIFRWIETGQIAILKMMEIYPYRRYICMSYTCYFLCICSFKMVLSSVVENHDDYRSWHRMRQSDTFICLSGWDQARSPVVGQGALAPTENMHNNARQAITVTPT